MAPVRTSPSAVSTELVVRIFTLPVSKPRTLLTALLMQSPRHEPAHGMASVSGCSGFWPCWRKLELKPANASRVSRSYNDTRQPQSSRAEVARPAWGRVSVEGGARQQRSSEKSGRR